MPVRTPLTLVTGPLGSGKTTLLRHILDHSSKRIAILMNEFGEIAIDSRIIQGKNVRIAELGGGCVCCSLLGEFEAAVEEVLEKVDPEVILVETTGVAEPDALVFDIQESLPQVRLDGVIAVVDADSMVKYPQLGHTTRLQIEAADTLLVNKIDLVSREQLGSVEEALRRIRAGAALLRSRRCRVDTEVLFGAGRERNVEPPRHVHQLEFESFYYQRAATFERSCFERFAGQLSESVYRAKGFVSFPEGSYLFNFVAGRWEMEPFDQEKSILVFIGKGVKSQKSEILRLLKACEIQGSDPEN